MTLPASGFDPDVYVPALLSTLNNRLSSGASDLYLARFGIGINEWRILTVLARRPGCSARDVAGRAAIHLTVISRGLRSLAVKGLVDITPGAAQRQLALTTAGRQLHDRIAVVALERERRLLAGLSADEVDQLRTLLGRLTGNLAEVDAHRPGADAGPA